MAKKKLKAVSEEKVEEEAPEPVVESSREPEPEAPLEVEESPKPMPEINPLPYLGSPPEEEPIVAPPVLPAPPKVEEAPSAMAEMFGSMNIQRLRVTVERFGIDSAGKSREELVAAVLAAQHARDAVAPSVVAAAEPSKPGAPPASLVAPTHSFLLGPGEKPEMVSAGGPPLPAPVKPKEETPKPKTEERPAARRKLYSHL